MNELKQQITEFEKFKSEIERNQLKFPLDVNSMEIVTDHAIIIPSQYDFVQLSIAAPFDNAMEVRTQEKKYLLESTGIVALVT